MKTIKNISVIAILALALLALISVNDAARAAPPDTPTCVAPANEAVFAEDEDITLISSDFSDPDEGEDDSHLSTSWRVIRYDNESEMIYEPNTGNLTIFTIGAYDLPPGFKYVWQVQYHDYYGPDPSEWSDECTFKVGDTTLETLDTIQAGQTMSDFDMFSVVHWPENPNPQEVYDISYDPNNHRIGTWDPEQGKYIEFGKGLSIEPGRAYWVLSRDDLVVSFDGIPVNMSYEVEVCLHTHPSTKMGWNMIAPPNASNYRWNDVLVGRYLGDNDPRNVSPVPVTSPVASTLINHRIYEWQSGNYVDHKLDENFVLKVYNGYWVKAIVDGAYLVFNESAQVAGLSTPRNTMLAWKGKAVRWMKSLLPSPREAIADSDLPPVPMSSFEDSANPLFEGCFVQTILK